MLKNQWNKIRSAIISRFDRLVIWTIRRRGYDVVQPLVFKAMVGQLKATDGYIRTSGALCTNTGRIPGAKKNLLYQIGRALQYSRFAMDLNRDVDL